MKTRLKWVALRAFRSFVERTVIPLAESGLESIKGANLDTGGSSRSGKSTIILAINYALGICHLPATSLQSWLTDEPMTVELALETDIGEVVITRGEKFFLTISGEEIRGSAQSLESKIQQILGLPMELLEALTYRRQRTRGHFLSKTNSEKQEFLTVLLGLDRFDTAIEKSQSHIRDLEPVALLLQEQIKNNEEEVVRRRTTVGDPALLDEIMPRKAVNNAQEKIRALEGFIQHEKKTIARIEQEIQEGTDKIIHDYIPVLQVLKAGVASVKAEVLPEPATDELDASTSALASTKAELQSAIKEDQVKQLKEQKEAVRLQAALDAAKKDLTAMQALKDEGLKLLGQIEILEKSQCYTCRQQWPEALAQKRALEARMAQVAVDLQERQIEGTPSRIEHLEKDVQAAWTHVPAPQIEALRTACTEQNYRVEQVRRSLEGFRHAAEIEHLQRVLAAETALKTTHTESLERAQCHQANASERLQGPQEDLERFQSMLQVANSELQGCQNAAHLACMKNAEARERAEGEVRALKDAEKRLEGTRTHAEGTLKELAAERDFVLLVGREGFLGAIFDEVLWEISTETNRILAGIPNTNSVSIHFRSETLTQKNKIKKEIVPVAIVDGHETLIKAGCSGGMEAAVELAVDLAVAQVVSRRTGAVPGWIILDEAFEGLGPAEK